MTPRIGYAKRNVVIHCSYIATYMHTKLFIIMLVIILIIKYANLIQFNEMYKKSYSAVDY